ncbi:hypothetical protein EDB86DRAFT_369518 [Lactarius hatsudake]|nr:hypothetical protein EDB86DRAFT_369518 [Lactarius hatsudake]
MSPEYVRTLPQRDPRVVRIARALAPKSRIFGTFGLGPMSHGWLAISVTSSCHSSLFAIDLDTFPLSPRSLSPSPSLALTSHRQGPPSTPTPSQNAPQPPHRQAARPCASCRLCPSRPRLRRIAHTTSPFQDVKITALSAFSHPQDAVRGRTDHRAHPQTRRRLLSCVISVSAPFTRILASFHLDDLF